MSEIIQELEYTLAEVNEVIEAIKSKAEPGQSPYQLQNMDGQFTLAQPLHTKALILSVIIPLRKEMEEPTKGKPIRICYVCEHEIMYWAIPVGDSVGSWTHVDDVIEAGVGHKATPKH